MEKKTVRALLRSLNMEGLSHDVVELILERVPAKSLLRFKSVSKQWKSTIESNNFKQKQMIHRQLSLDVLFLSFPYLHSYDDDDDDDTEYIPSSLSFSVDDNDDDDDNDIKIISSSAFTTVKFPTKKMFRCTASCDGLLCFYNDYESIVFNPTTRWHRTLPPSNLQQQQRRSQWVRNKFGFARLGFGKDKFNGAYKLVWLYNNSQEFDKNETITTGEVFDFSINAWRYVTPPSSYEIIHYIRPVYVDGSLHWLTTIELKTQVLSFDLHTKAFEVIAEAPFDKAKRYHYKMCNLNNRLCVSETNWPNQVIWLFDSGSKTWNHMHSIDLKKTYSWFRKSSAHEIRWYSGNCIGSLQPLAVLEEKNGKTKVLFFFYANESYHLVIYDGKSYDSAFTFNSFMYPPVCYFQSLISIL